MKKVGIIGLGLIGGSIAKKLKQVGYPIFTVKSNSSDVQKAKKWIDRVFPTLEALIKEVDLLILATPLKTIIPLAKKIKATHPLLVIDVGSVKSEIVKEFEKLSRGSLEFLSTHPMAGTEKKGFEASDPNLFKEAPWIVVPHKKNRSEIEPFIRLFGAKPIRMSAKEHDKKVALVSHLPMILSKALWDFVNEEDPTSIDVAGPSFQCMTRLAKGNQELFADILEMNQQNIRKVLKEWIKALRKKSFEKNLYKTRKHRTKCIKRNKN